MCRWIAYSGEPIFLEELIAKPENSLLTQSLHAREAKVETNGDGFGFGWYAHRDEPGHYREVLPAWNDENLRSLSRQIRSPMFFSHVRASTGTATNRSNCHPFVQGRWMFMHNGQVGSYAILRRQLEGLIPDELYSQRIGTTDSEALFLAAYGRGLNDDPFGAVCATIDDILDLMEEAEISEPLRFTAAFADGNDIYAFRYSSDEFAPSLYHCKEDDSLLIVSEPLDEGKHDWQAVPQGHAIIGNGKEGAPLIKEMTMRPRSGN
ncbi:MAG: class II glutamine amidotransferase [Rhodospirillaceae bacterium]|jgi:predicted glutamine amidotransferase|nr:class II glutamine amidotransferase [Rhodospirillaceae bacterium]MBT5244142.1 class II glutamine amidotransferase [Rhodospirillaceae bacterium]MBT5561667.1 class II glutamine amidotransferase [Rhodospirillaceae bacterium]MBT6243106.1 class II glutamine amidotransferase [Rhodospirillaceae bacterium]MBT7137864.1 class II glutamine amidotransferase [Rhodospirillaceae bacterium]